MGSTLLKLTVFNIKCREIFFSFLNFFIYSKIIFLAVSVLILNTLLEVFNIWLFPFFWSFHFISAVKTLAKVHILLGHSEKVTVAHGRDIWNLGKPEANNEGSFQIEVKIMRFYAQYLLARQVSQHRSLWSCVGINNFLRCSWWNCAPACTKGPLCSLS